MSSKKRYLTASAETREQFAALLETEAALIYIDSGYFEAADWSGFCALSHAAGKCIGLRFPRIFRAQAAAFFQKQKRALISAGFNAFLLESMEELCWLRAEGVLSALGEGISLVSDHALYAANAQASALIREAFSASEGKRSSFVETLPLELNERELAALLREDREIPHELLVYGRAPMMVSAQCVRKTVCGCDHKQHLLYLRDRKGMQLPVKNCCAFCYNTILNAQPTVLCDLSDALSKIGAERLRYEFTTESAEEVKEIMAGKRIWKDNAFTRGHFKRGVE